MYLESCQEFDIETIGSSNFSIESYQQFLLKNMQKKKRLRTSQAFAFSWKESVILPSLKENLI